MIPRRIRSTSGDVTTPVGVRISGQSGVSPVAITPSLLQPYLQYTLGGINRKERRRLRLGHHRGESVLAAGDRAQINTPRRGVGDQGGRADPPAVLDELADARIPGERRAGPDHDGDADAGQVLGPFQVVGVTLGGGPAGQPEAEEHHRAAACGRSANSGLPGWPGGGAGCDDRLVSTAADDPVRARLLRRGFVLEYVTLGWNVAGIIVLAIAAVAARSVALAGFGLDSLIEIGASVVVVWELSGTGEDRQRRGLRLIGYAFAALAMYLLAQSTLVLAAGYHPRHSVLGIAWTAVTAAVMFALAAGKARTGRALGNPVLRTEGRVTMIDGILAVAVLAALVLNAAVGWWQADPAAGFVLVYYAAREVREIFFTR